MCTPVRQNFWKVSSNSEHHSKPTMNINSQHHNLLGNQISPKSEDFCIWHLIEMLYGMCINGFEAWKFQNACRCHGNCKNTQFNAKVNNNHIFSDLDKISGKFHPIPSTIANKR
jgi:hypothetical protein